MQLLQPGELLAAEPIVRVACGDWHTICVAVDGTAYSFGNGDHGKLGLGHELAQHEPARPAAWGPGLPAGRMHRLILLRRR